MTESVTVPALPAAPDVLDEASGPRRFKCFEDTHQEMIEAAVRLISQKGVEALSIAAVARALGINRTTVYYHFNSREALINAVRAWSSAQLAKAFKLHTSQHERIDYLTRFVLGNPELIKLWIEEFVSPGDVRNSYPHWDALVDGVKASVTTGGTDAAVDAEVFCIILITSTIIGPRVLRNRVSPDDDDETIVRRFRVELERWLKQLSLRKAG